MAPNEAYEMYREGEREALEWFQNELAGLRTGRVTPALVANIPVEHYGARTPLQGVASVSGLDARSLAIAPWDQSAIAAIEKALTDAQLGAQPIVDGGTIRLSFPMLSEEVRERTVKTLHRVAEDTRVRLRQARDEALSRLTRERRGSEITEDDFYQGKKQLDHLISKSNQAIDDQVAKKETEIRQI